ncbi:protein kinase [Actinomyces bouchesdurhonensis]|uniref:serine/threonine protein kinase n=1 Tax=Actinomyces bouchesdurhonensis TaxID=1852361 RepID=UPI0028EDE029|nr:protein kinase [Actinomyces bouchesdurhonensis]
MTSGAGRVLGGRYTLLTPIAQGGMGEVWKARDRVSGHIVAAKVLRPELAGEELSLSRLRLEARNSMSISHPNIANTQDSGQEDGIGWIIMELVDGYPLTDYLRGGSRIEPEYLMPILIQVAMALGAAARAGVVHRDIKPANILVRPDGMVKLTDFGISRARDQVNLTAAGMVMGTAQYLPPEQAMGEIATPTGDLYALGVIAYEAAAGRRPFTGETQVDIAFAHVNDPVPPLPDFVPEPLADVILHLLEKDPAKRPESGSAAVREIAAAAKAMGISVTPRPLPLPKAAQRPTEVRTPVQPSVPILAPVRHLTRRTLPDEMLQPPSGLNPRVRSVTGRHAVVPRIIDEATTIAPSSSMIPITGRHVTVPRIIDEAPPPPVAPPPVARPVSAPIRTRRQRPDATGEQAPVVGSTRSLTSTGRHAAVPPAPQRPTSTSTPSRADSTPAATPVVTESPAPRRPAPARQQASPAPATPVERPQAMVPAQATTASSGTDTIPTPPTTTGTQAPIDRRAALNERLRQRAANRQAEDAAEEQRRAQVAREEQERQRELREAREARQRKEARQRHDAEQVYRHASHAPVPQPTRDTRESAAKDTTASSQTSTSTGSTPRVLGTVPQPRAKKKSSTASTRPRRSVFEPRSEKKTRRPKWHELDARSAEQKRPAAKTAYSRSVVAPPVPTVKKVIRWVVVTLIVIALIALAAVTIRHMLSSLIQSNAGATITEEVRTWHSPWPTV